MIALAGGSQSDTLSSVSSRDVRSRLARRAAKSNLFVPDSLADRLVSYYELLTRWNRKINLTSIGNVDEAVADADVVMLLRIQLERMEGAYFPSLREYFRVFGMTEARLRQAKQDVMILHPGPMNRGVEIASEVADGPYSVILDQVANGVAVRMAVLYLLAGGAEHEEAA